MTPTEHDALASLLASGQIPPGWIIDGNLTFRHASTRNCNLRVEGPGGVGFFLKQPADPLLGGARTLRNEAAFYNFCASEPAASPVARYLPRLAYRDVSRSVHALELVPNARTLEALLRQDPAAGCLVEAMRELGRALGTLHRVFRLPGLADDARLSGLERTVPWALKAGRPAPGMLAILSPASCRVFQIIQQEQGMEARLDELRARWRAETMIHGDVRCDNILVQTIERSRRHAGQPIWIIDWEHVQVGDAAWDLAGVLGEILGAWTSSMPVGPGVSPDEMTARAHCPLTSLRPGLMACWEGYRSAAGLLRAENEQLINRAVAYSAARLIQAAYEHSAERDVLPAQAVIMLQISANLLADPALGQAHLYGLPGESSLE
jgi:aminoglycoside phosphotransferase (APT) family kinase protein